MINREEYLEKLISFKDTKLIKVVTGIRRSGKSTLFLLYQEYLLNNGIREDQIISINFEDMQYEDLLDYRKLYQYVSQKLLSNERNYIFFDEAQNVEKFEKAVDSLYIKNNVDLYITGSNSKLLSGELATLLSGRYIEIFMLPLSFKEYVSAFPTTIEMSKRFGDYQINSSFPGALELLSYEKINEYLAGIYNTIVLKDIVARLNIADVMMLESVIRFLFDNIGNLCNTKKIADTLTSMGRKISVHTVERYLSGLTDSYVLYPVGRFDIKGKQYLKSGEKYYLADIGLRYYLLGSKDVDYGHILENIIYLELLRRNYKVYIGKAGLKEIDFIVMKTHRYEYYQVSLSVRDKQTLERELAPLKSIDDHYPKYILTLDDDPNVEYDGIRQINAIDWLLGKID